MKTLSISLIALAIAGCAATPLQKPPRVINFATAEPIDHADKARQYVEQVIKPSLRDPESLQVDYSITESTLIKGRCEAAGAVAQVYATTVGINARNGFGGLTGNRPYTIIFKNGNPAHHKDESILGFGMERGPTTFYYRCYGLDLG